MARTKRKPIPKFTVANVFVISRVPDTGSIPHTELLRNLEDDLKAAKERGVKLDTYMARSIDAQIRALLTRFQLGHFKKGNILYITRNERTERYMRTIPKGVWTIVDKIPMSNPLLLLAGSAPNEPTD